MSSLTLLVSRLPISFAKGALLVSLGLPNWPNDVSRDPLPGQSSRLLPFELPS